MGLQILHKTFSFKTSELNSLRSKLSDGSNRPGFTFKLYDVSENEITDQPTADSACVKTVIDYLPDYNYQLKGGEYIQTSNPATDMFASVIGAPGLTYAQGRLDLLPDFNLRIAPLIMSFEGLDFFDVTYDPVYESSKFRFELKHGAGVKHELQVLLRYR